METITLANDNKLKKVKDEATILNLLSGAKHGNSEVFIWKLIGNEKHLGQVRIESIRKSRKDFCIIPAEGQDRLVQELMGSHNHVDLYIPESALLLRCAIKQTDAPYRYYLQLPNFVAQVERRQSFRLNVHGTSEVKLSFGKSVALPRPMSQHFLKECFDISAGGFSFFISKMETKFFQIDDAIPMVEIKAGNWTTKISAQIATIREVEPDEYNGLAYKVWRVSCRFSQIDQVSRKYLEKFIFERIKDELHAINE
ncbi:PilZ domain-containing protein [Peredibacter sp. HCB2-198]|uniref:PilZ domain-containing protein n=1 Tax=Peredibacter sp. HCB2-198 TaxID=3383025 RepID=UPI0038B65E5A